MVGPLNMYSIFQDLSRCSIETRVSSERNISRKNAKKMQQFLFAFRKNAKCENFVKTMSVIAATINCSKELVEFSALIPQYLKFYHVILIISLPLYFNKCLMKRILFLYLSFTVSVCPSTIHTFNHDYEAMYFSQKLCVFFA